MRTPNKDSAEQIIAALRSADLDVTPEEQFEIELHEKGKALHHLTLNYGWEVLKEMIDSYVDGAVEDLIRRAPGDPIVLTAHAAASALSDFRIKLTQDIARAIEASMKTPEVMKQGYKKLSTAAPLDSM